MGPTIFGSLAPEWQAFLFPREGANAIVLDGIRTLAIVLFLLVAGMEVDLSTIWKQGRAAIKVSVLGIVVPFGLGLLGAAVMPRAFGREIDADPVIFALFLATAMAISALPVIAKTLMDLDLYRTDLGMVVVSAAIFDDLAGWTLFALILGLTSEHDQGFGIGVTLLLTFLFALLILTAGRWLVHRTLPILQAYTHYPGGVIGFAVTLGLLGATFTEYIGIHAIFGAFLVGVALGDSSHLQERTRVMIDEFVSFVFAPLFFATLGLKVNFATHFDGLLVLLVFILACAGKFIGAVLAARWGGFPNRECWAIGFAMNSRGAMEIILATLALEAGIIRQRLFVALVVMAILTSALSGPLMRWVLRRPKPHRLLSYVAPKLFLRELRADSRLDVIRELAAVTAREHGLDAAAIEKLAWEREQIAATGIGHGVAIPHARLADIRQPVVAVGISEAGIDFDAPDGQPAHVIFLLVTPRANPEVQLELSADIAHTFREPHGLERILRASTFTEFVAKLKALSSA